MQDPKLTSHYPCLSLGPDYTDVYIHVSANKSVSATVMAIAKVKFANFLISISFTNTQQY
jgi:hypothetical protein